MDVPPDAALVCDFVNTCDLEDETDTLDSEAALVSWLHQHGLASTDGTVTAADLDRAHALREALRSLLQSHHRHVDGAPEDGTVELGGPRAVLDDIAHELPLVLHFGAEPRLVPAGRNASAGLAGLLAAVARSAADGSWARVKVCSADTCRWAFYDTSKNRSRTWCAMRICGNRAKTTNYRARQRSSADG